MGDNLVVYGITETMKLIESGAVGKIVCYEDLNYIRVRLRNSETDTITSVYIRPENITNAELYKDKDTGVVLEKLEEDDNFEVLNVPCVFSPPAEGDMEKLLKANGPLFTQLSLEREVSPKPDTGLKTGDKYGLSGKAVQSQ